MHLCSVSREPETLHREVRVRYEAITYGDEKKYGVIDSTYKLRLYYKISSAVPASDDGSA